MKKNIARLAVSCLMVMALLLASCAPAATPTPTQTPTPTPKPTPTPMPAATAGTEMVVDSLGRLVEKPKYGGTVNFVYGTGVAYLDPIYGSSRTPLLYLTNDKLLMPDLLKGPGGTVQWAGSHNMFPGLPVMVGSVAESWELADPVTLIFHIRKGIRYALNPASEASRLVGGREIIADDVVFSSKQCWENPNGYMYQTKGGALASITAPDKYTVVVKSPSAERTAELLEAIVQQVDIFPKEVYDKYGNMANWQNSVGSGPFMLVDFLSGSCATFVRNPNWWFKDPFHPENQLPYVDKVKWLIIQDRSTMLAAVRAGKVDQIGGDPETSVSWQDAANLMKTNPDLKRARVLLAYVDIIFMKFGTKPFDDIRVRRALSMAIDSPAIVRDLYGGNAEVNAYPIGPTPDWADVYTPLEKLPQSTRELFEYHPDKAKQLLAEAGYPSGFKTSIVTMTDKADLVSLVASYWAKIGVDLEIEVKEKGVYTSLATNKTYKQMIMYAANFGSIWSLLTVRTSAVGSASNPGGVADSRCDEAYRQIWANYFDESQRRQILRDISVYILGQDYFIPTPAPYVYTFWQPWIKGYNGEYIWSFCSRDSWMSYVWIDQKLKTSMGK